MSNVSIPIFENPETKFWKNEIDEIDISSLILLIE